LINRPVDKTFFLTLKKLFEQHHGDDEVELVIGERTIPVPLKVSYGNALKKDIETLLE